jgi:hypothetical protein
VYLFLYRLFKKKYHEELSPYAPQSLWRTARVQNNRQKTRAGSQLNKARKMEMCLNTFCFPFLLVGVVSWGVDCGVSDIPGIYASVKAAACWIDWAASCGLRRPERL